MSPSRGWRGVLLAALLLLAPSVSRGGCDQILLQGVFDEYARSGSNRSRAFLDRLECSQRAWQDFPSAAPDLKALADSGYGDLHYDRTRSQDEGQNRCDPLRTHVGMDQVIQEAKVMAQPPTLRAWARCNQTQAQGLSCAVDRLDSGKLQFIASYGPGPRGQKPPPIETVTILPSDLSDSCTGNLRVGAWGQTIESLICDPHGGTIDFAISVAGAKTCVDSLTAFSSFRAPRDCHVRERGPGFVFTGAHRVKIWAEDSKLQNSTVSIAGRVRRWQGSELATFSNAATQKGKVSESSPAPTFEVLLDDEGTSEVVLDQWASQCGAGASCADSSGTFGALDPPIRSGSGCRSATAIGGDGNGWAVVSWECLSGATSDPPPCAP